MNGNGPAALLHYLQNYDLTGFNVRKAPETEGLRNQKIASLRNIELWWFEMLNRGISAGGCVTCCLTCRTGGRLLSRA